MRFIDNLLGRSKAVNIALEKKQLAHDLELKHFATERDLQISSRLAVDNLFRYNGGIGDNKLIEEGFMSNADVYSIITSLAELGSKIPFIVEKKTPEGWELDEESKLNDLIKQPNESLSEVNFRYNSLIYLLNTGDIFWKKTISSFDLVTETEILEPNLVDFIFDTFGEVNTIQYSRNNATQIDYTPDEVIHNMYLNPSIKGLESKRGMSPMEAAYMNTRSSNNRSVASASMLENGGAANLISSGSELSMSPEENEETQKAFNKKVGGASSFGKNVITTANVKVNSLGLTAQQMQVLEGAVMDRRSICNVFKVDSSLFNDKEASTFNNITTVSKSVYTRAVIPNNETIISGYNKIIPAYNRFEGKELRIVQDLSGIEALQVDQKTKAEKDNINVNSVTAVLSSPTSRESKIETLVNVMDIDRDKAVLIVGKEIKKDENI